MRAGLAFLFVLCLFSTVAGLPAAASSERACGSLRVTLSGRNLFNSDYYFNGNRESADPGPPRQVLVSTTIRIR